MLRTRLLVAIATAVHCYRSLSLLLSEFLIDFGLIRRHNHQLADLHHDAIATSYWPCSGAWCRQHMHLLQLEREVSQVDLTRVDWLAGPISSSSWCLVAELQLCIYALSFGVLHALVPVTKWPCFCKLCRGAAEWGRQTLNNLSAR